MIIVMRNNLLIVIPSRLNSKRLKRKPLQKIGKKTLIERVYENIKKIQSYKIIVATDSIEILNTCKKSNIPCVLTSKKHKSGSDRVAEIAKRTKFKWILNLQGDEPLINITDVKKLINKTLKYNKKKPDFVASTLHVKKKFVKAWRQVCIYSYPYKALMAFSSNKKKTQLESIEDCELIRFLELGYDVKMISMSNKSISVDTKQDLIKIKKILS